MGALSLVSEEGELGAFYERKIAKGKEKMVALNALQNKLIHRTFALVRYNKMYEKKYQNKFA